MKKLVMVIGALAILLLGAIIAIPFFVDVDKYRPQIVQVANEHINGKLELGKLKLSLWGQIRIEVGGLTLADSAGKPILKVTDAHVHLPFSSVFSGSPSLQFRMDKPVVTVVKNKAGKMNVMSLLKGEGEASTPQKAATPSSSGQSVALPAMATQARMTVELRDAQVSYLDEATALSSVVKDLNLVVRDISLSRTTEIEIWANLDTSMGKVFQLKGPARITAKVKPEVSGGKLDKITASGKADMDSLQISVPGSFEKPKGVPCNAEFALAGSSKEAKIERVAVRFHNAELKGQGTLTQFPAPTIQFKATSNDIDLKAWGDLIPMAKAYEMTGTGSMDVEASGLLEKLFYQATVKAANVTAKTPMVKTRPTIDALVVVKPDTVDRIQMTMKAPGTDLRISGKMVGFTESKLDVKIESSGMDLDQWVDFPKPGAGGAAGASAGSSGGASSGAGTGSGGAAAKADYDAMIEPMRKNAWMQAFAGKIDLNIKSMKAYGVHMTDIASSMAMKDLNVKLDSFGMKLWSGSLKTQASMQLKPKTPTYQFNANVAGLEIQQAVESQFALFKNTILGKANLEISGEGASFNPDQATTKLKAKGKMRVENATFATVDIARMTTEAINGALEKIGDKIPSVKGKKVGMGSGKSYYEYVASTFVISDGVFSAPDFYAKAVPNKGVELKGTTEVGLKPDYSLKTRWEIIDTYDLTEARKISPEHSGVQVPHILAEGNGPVRFPVSAGCKAVAPCYSYTEVPEFLAKVALGNVSQAVAGKAKAEVKKKIEQVIPANAPPAIQNGLKKLFGR